MSIPPLVCSTPPPPDQCEDDKDPEDFELSYSLSQDDDDDDSNGFNYGNFSAYNNYQSTADDNKPLEIKQHEITENTESPIHKEVFLNYQNVKETECINAGKDVFRKNDINENKLKCDEDLSIEDLNLKVDEEINSIIESNNSLHNEISESNIVTVKDFHIPSDSSNDSPSCDNIPIPAFDENATDVTDTLKQLNINFVEQEDALSNHENPLELQSGPDQLPDNVEISGLEEAKSPEQVSAPDITFKIEETTIHIRDNIEPIAQSSNVEVKCEEDNLDDDFGDFDDFQSVLNTTTNVTSFVGISNNPWENAESNESGFTATFEETKFQVTDSFSPAETVSIPNNLDPVNTESVETDKKLDDEDDGDDFGDFDDFKSSSVKVVPIEATVEDTSNCQELPVLNLQSIENEQQIMESISNVLSSVFLEEITEPEDVFEGTLESLLSETWGHLMETDERQPYIVNWNNSLGQKTLLKALCIDSRNILFGPKWSNMPKYAANLSNAPLQPQKQASVPSSIVTQSETLADKPPSKSTTWTDPFTSDGQESCNNDSENAAVTAGPADLGVFEPAVSTKSDNIYSNTIGVQPLRHINLPDTHIFTPTDSEIPRSKTIHYDGPSTLLPQPFVSDTKNQMETVNTANVNSIENSIDDNEYWDFQNFQSNSEPNSLPRSNSQQDNNRETATTVNVLPKPNIAYQTNLLQPIKVEPTKPTLNWPDPGEINTGFDDFSDFVSISPQSVEKTGTTQPVESHPEVIMVNKSENIAICNERTDVTEKTQSDIDSFDDDFDTFQSALPSKSVVDNFKSPYLENRIGQVSSSQIPEFGSQKYDSIKSDTISFGNILRPNEALTQNLGHTSNNNELTRSSLPSGTQIQTNILQPTPASFTTLNTQNQQKSGQILQPLSLESYSQINWPSPGIDLQDLSRFNPVESLNSLKSDLSASGLNKGASPVHVTKNTIVNQIPDDDVWGEFVSSKPKQQQQSQSKKSPGFVDDDEWTDFISSPSVKPQNGLNTISLNVHTNSNIQKSVQNKYAKKTNQPPLDIPTLNYITPKANSHKSYNDKHFQNL